MISVQEAEKIVLAQSQNYGTEYVPLKEALGRITASKINADRDFPPFDRVSMDGISIRFSDFKNGTRSFPIEDIQAAGQSQKSLTNKNSCLEVMTGAVCPANCDTVIRYEDLEISDGIAKIMIDDIGEFQNVHAKGLDRNEGEVIMTKNHLVRASEIAVLATVGAAQVEVYKRPKVAIISNGDELVGVDHEPLPHQIRRSNVYAIEAVLKGWNIDADLLHLADNEDEIFSLLQDILQSYDILLLSGGVSMGKYDYLPDAMNKLGVELLFHKVQQRPGKPFWFGRFQNQKLVFAFPGNPVSTFMCSIRYFIPFFKKCIGLNPSTPFRAQLGADFKFKPPLQYFLQVKLSTDNALIAHPLIGHGSGDLANLVDVDGFLELPEDRTEFSKGEVFPFWAIGGSSGRF